MQEVTRGQALVDSEQQLMSVSDSPRLDAELLLAFSCQIERVALYAHAQEVLTEEQHRRFLSLLQRRLQQEPLAYILGVKSFWTFDVLVNSDVLIPRPETECLVEWILSQYGKEALRVADLGTGSGAIAMALASERPQWQITASDISLKALEVARHNLAVNHLDNVTCLTGSWCDALPRSDYHLIVSNPPYIVEADPHLTRLSHEPIGALVADMDGLQAIYDIIISAKHYLCKDGCLVIEHGVGQGMRVCDMLQAAGYVEIASHDDLSHCDRFVTAIYRGGE